VISTNYESPFVRDGLLDPNHNYIVIPGSIVVRHGSRLPLPERSGYIKKKCAPIPMEHRYWLVVVIKKPIALVRCWDSSQKLVYGRDAALSCFHDGEPLVTSQHTKLLWITDNPSDPRIQVSISRLKKRQERKRPKQLPETSRMEIRKQRNAGHSVKKLAQHFGVSEATIKRICRNKASRNEACGDTDPHTLGVAIE
jgi:hypothetical protein